MCNNTLHKEEEYIDYSCSTSVERLTRDVESLLRSWHIHDGCDRHYSVNTDRNGLSQLRTERLTWTAHGNLSIPLQLSLWDGPASRAPQRKKKKSSRRNRNHQSSQSGSPKSPSKKTKGGFFKSVLHKSKKGSRRSSVSNDECALDKRLKDIKDTFSIGLDDDMDSSNHTTCTDWLDDDDEDDYEEEEDERGQSSNSKSKKKKKKREKYSHLPKSLQRPQHDQDLTYLPESLFDNFSTLFGIGQHITLTPVQPDMELQQPNNNNNNNSLALLCQSLLGRHKPQPARQVLTQILATWLQTALNNAAMNCQSCLPVFGVWGHYPSLPQQPSSLTASSSYASFADDISSTGSLQVQQQQQPCNKALIPVFPPWLDTVRANAQIQQAVMTMEQQQQQQQKRPHKRSSGKLTPFSPRRRSKSTGSMGIATSSSQQKTIQQDVNAAYIPPLVTGSVIPTTDVYANFTCAVLPQTGVAVDRMSTWGQLLLRYCDDDTHSNNNNNSVVVLSGARHVYAWWKDQVPAEETQSWRGMDPKEYWKQQQQQASNPPTQQVLAALPFQQEEIEDYHHACRAHALKIMEQGTGRNAWGPTDDPIKAVHAKVVWNSECIVEDDKKSSSTIQALASFPSPTSSDSTHLLLDPKRASSFRLKAFLDSQALEPTLATTQRCVLACLIRTCTLAPLTLLRHLLWEEDIVEDWDHDAGDRAAMQISQRAKVGDATMTLVDVMDWKTCAEEMIATERAQEIVTEVFEGNSSYGFPSPPDDMFSRQQGLYNQNKHPLLEPLFQSAPIGRLLSDLCARMAQLRTPCSMALLWSTFCHELRHRWGSREPLPHMSFVPGLDPSPTVLAERRKWSTIGVKADLAAFLNCSEPDPDDQHCLIGQKLQVFNIGIETMTAMEAQRERSFDDQDPTEQSMDSPTSSDLDKMNDGSNSSVQMPARATSLVSMISDGLTPAPSKEEAQLKSPTSGMAGSMSSLSSFQLPSDLFKGRSRNNAIIDGLLMKEKPAPIPVDKEDTSTASDSVDSEFFDAEECGMSIFSNASFFSKNLATTVVHRIDRKGARCPLHGCSLVASGDQVYAPYLLRPEPLTDDMILDRRVMLAGSDMDGSDLDASEASRVPVQQRLEIAYRLQKPKLLSDMNAFKAANPGAIFQDFVSWYGNPGNPLEDYAPRSSTVNSQPSHSGLATTESVAVKLDKATEAIHILNETRNFWSNTWDEATAVPASEQNPLFEVFSTVEMTLDYLENMHPAIMVNQLMAVTFSNSYYTLVASAKDAVKVKVVESSIQRLRNKTEEVLEVLGSEASNATNAFYNMQAGPRSNGANFVSIEAIHLCEEVCAALSESEIMIALATSLLQKFPGQYDSVQHIMKHADGDEVELQDTNGQDSILEVIRMQQAGNVALPNPMLREYLLRNLDDANPCQLSVRYCESSSDNNQGGLMIGLTRTQTD
ncbi:Rab3 GTPase-activating protein catalytic subunit [Seminavis robusta]|uniref:Rab3 GTPase-activating protein catalytic subunit n=1 Tax=Seminavis robusta TaxID=568900 RepID=A0A9N8DH75_9STRA|nr:Rab3 GTPase-activating protein catalytic subunit [Seminavis robusta]|eukprot:Sro87_g046010.1 Rab3 GTPase-activating protein catalytic subunit (1441) ;mRNA; f:33617-38190